MWKISSHFTTVHNKNKLLLRFNTIATIALINYFNKSFVFLLVITFFFNVKATFTTCGLKND